MIVVSAEGKERIQRMRFWVRDGWRNAGFFILFVGNLSVLPPCDSVMIVLSLFIHSSSHCCSTSSRNEIIPLFSASIRISESADRSVRRDASIAMNRCLYRSYQENDLLITWWTVNVFDYILLAILTSNRSFGHLRCAKNARNLHIHQLHSLESTYYSCISNHPIRKILWWERC